MTGLDSTDQSFSNFDSNPFSKFSRFNNFNSNVDKSREEADKNFTRDYNEFFKYKSSNNIANKGKDVIVNLEIFFMETLE